MILFVGVRVECEMLAQFLFFRWMYMFRAWIGEGRGATEPVHRFVWFSLCDGEWGDEKERKIVFCFISSN